MSSLIKKNAHLEIRQVRADVRVMRLAEEQVPKTELLRFRLEFFNDRNMRLPPECGVHRDLRMIHSNRRDHIGLDESAELGQQVFGVR